MLNSEVFPQLGFPTSATLMTCLRSSASLAIILFNDHSSSESSAKIVSYEWSYFITSFASLSPMTSICSASLRRNDSLYPSISYSIGSFNGAFSTTVTFFPAMNPISISLFLKLPWPLTFTITPCSPVFNSDNFINHPLNTQYRAQIYNENRLLGIPIYGDIACGAPPGGALKFNGGSCRRAWKGRIYARHESFWTRRAQKTF